MPGNVEDIKYVDLWKYFQDKATSVKGAMFTTITWVLGFAAAMLAYMFSNLEGYSLDAKLDIKIFVLLVSVSGLSLCGYALYAICESARQIKKNWINADKCREEVPGLRAKFSSIVETEIKCKCKYFMGVPICKRLAVIVYMFCLVFILVPFLVFLL